MGESVLKFDSNRQKWQERLNKAKLAYQDELSKMDLQDQYYNGTRKLQSDPNTKRAPSKEASNVRNIVYELIESQVDSTIPMPRVEAIHEEDRELAKKVEALLRNKISTGHFLEMNDLQERTVPIQGGSFWHVEWDDTAGTHCTLGDVSVTDRHPKQVIPQPGVYEIENMDYLFVQVAQTKEFIRRRYGVDVKSEGEEEPGIRGSEDVASEGDLVTQNIAYYRDEDGKIGMFSWVGNQTLEDLPDYQARMVERCARCGKPKAGDVCECGSRKFKREKLEEEELFEDIQLYDGTIVPHISGEYATELTDKDGFPIMGEDGIPLTQTVAELTKIPYYEPGLYPVVLRRNIRHFGTLLGGSDAAVIRDQQNTIKKLGSKIDEKILKGGSFVTLPDGVNVETTERELKIIRIKTPAQRQLIDVLNIQPDVTKERLALEDNYSWAKSTLGITDAFQGKYDSSATSGTAKQFSANQSAGRLQSKREMKNQAYARLYELMFKFLLAYSDQPVPYSTRDEKGNLTYDHFNRMDFLRQDAAGELYWDDEFIFTVDPSATLSSNRDLLWQQIAQNYQSAAFGPLNETSTQVLLWRLYELTNYPYAGQIRQALEAKQQQEEQMAQMAASMQQMGGAADALSQMQGGNAGAGNPAGSL